MTRGVLLVAILCVASLCDVAPVRRGEQLLAALLLPMDSVVRRLAPATEVAEAPLAMADSAWASWQVEVADRPLPQAGDVGLFVAPVEKADEARHELVVRVPDDAELRSGSPVTHRGALVGFLLPWRLRATEVVSQGRARVGLLGHREIPAIAASWTPHDGSHAVPFLLTADGEGAAVSHLKGAIDARVPALAVTRDVAALGVDLPPGLLLGRIAPKATDAPGGGVQFVGRASERLDPMVSTADLSLVTIEAPVGAAFTIRLHRGRVLTGIARDDRLLVDCGTLQGLLLGDPVVQDGRWIGRVSLVGPTTAVVTREPPPGALLVEVAEGVLEPIGQDAAVDSSGQRPLVGAAVFSGHPTLGGVFVGRVQSAGHAGYEVALPEVDSSRAVTLVGR